MKKAGLHNLGCKVNAYETEAMQEMLEQKDMRSFLLKKVRMFILLIRIHSDKYSRQEISADAAPSEKIKPGRGRCGGGMLCPGAGGLRRSIRVLIL